MELVERYLQAIRFWLPRELAADVSAELKANLEAQIEDRVDALGRPLNEAELEEILRHAGAPMLVAMRYAPQRYLIGPTLFPLYIFVLKILALCYLIPGVLTWFGIAIYAPELHLSGGGWAHQAGDLVKSFFSAAFATIAATTVAFAILEHLDRKHQFMARWDPRKLPALRNPNLISRASSGFEIGFLIFFLGWFAANMQSSVIVNQPTFQLVFTPVWTPYFWGIFLVTLASLGLSVANLAHPFWTMRRASIKLVVDLAGGAIFCAFLRANIVQSITAVNVAPEKTAALCVAINSWAGRMLPFGILLVGIACSINVFRLWRLHVKL